MLKWPIDSWLNLCYSICMTQQEVPATSERKDGPTPNGGAYSIAYFQNEKGEATTKDKATRMEIVEFSKAGIELHRTYGDIKH